MRIFAVFFGIIMCGIAHPIQSQNPPSTSTPIPPQVPQVVTSQDVKQAAAVLEKAQEQTSQKTAEVGAQVQQNEKRMDDLTSIVHAQEVKMASLKGQIEANDESLLEKTPATPEEVRDLKSELKIFEEQMQEQSRKWSTYSEIVLGAGLCCGVLSLVCSLFDQGKASAVLAVLVGAIVAINTYKKFDARENLYSGLAAAAGEAMDNISLPRPHYSLIVEGYHILAGLRGAEKAASSGDLGAVLRGYTQNASNGTPPSR
jgi:hypothetical protein